MAIFTAIGGYLTATFGPMIAGIIGNLAIGVALIGAQQLFFGVKRPTSATPQAQATINQSNSPRIRGYGYARLGGTRAFFDSKNGGLDQIVMAHHGRIESFQQFYVGDIAVTLDGNGFVLQNPPAPHVRIIGHLGSPYQLANTAMLERWPEVWTEQHRLQGIAYWYVLFGSPPAEDFQKVFPDSYNTPVTCVCRLSLVWDPRDPAQDPDDESTWLWSDTAALCILDYLRHQDGYRLTVDDIDIPSFIEKANRDEDQIATASGGFEERYRIWGVYSLSDDPEAVLGKMRTASDAEFYETPDGKLAIRGGTWSAPTVTITEQDIIGHSMEQGNNRFAAFNELKLLYTSSDHHFQTMEATAWVDLEDQEARGPLESSLDLDMVPSASQARRLAKIHIAKSNPKWKGTISANLSALDALGERTVRIVLPELDIDDAFFVAGFAIRPDLTGVEMSVMSISEASYTWSTAEEGEAAPIPEDTAPDLTFPVPDGLILTADEDLLITATVDDPARSDLELQVQIRAGAGSLWQEMFTASQTVAEFGPVAPAEPTTYQARARWRGPLNTVGGWSTPLAEIILP